MLTCIPCLNTRGLVKGVTHQIRGMSLKAAGGQQKRRMKSRKREKSTAEAKEAKSLEKEEEWVAEAEPGVLITLVALPNGGNHLKKIRFSEELFDAWEAQRWWSNNRDKIMELYSIHQDNSPRTPVQSDDECPTDSDKVEKYDESSNTSCNSCDLAHVSRPDLPTKAPTGESSRTRARGTEVEVGEMVVEDEPGVFVTFRTTQDGSKELLRVELSREMFGEVKARVWWEENKARLQKQYA